MIHQDTNKESNRTMMSSIQEGVVERDGHEWKEDDFPAVTFLVSPGFTNGEWFFGSSQIMYWSGSPFDLLSLIIVPLVLAVVMSVVCAVTTRVVISRMDFE